ncbi:hypothetical protein N0V93_002659 [Gnomoniopsis smithogilvyi]|uniref:Amine oxidase n=1 Tax=Gnomoniopsis smithogilvyi TaxID=1191159 RepID=A0A9W9CZD5_9PEZI|nr:hypothetical protein N0V93_002659 [Gnomoniopsis smithogilvyi]
MHFMRNRYLALVSSLWAATRAQGDTTQIGSIVETDVIIIGGGASGAHAAVRLTDFGQKVVLIEKQPELGGAVDSYTDVTDGKSYNFGVQAWVDYGNSTQFFERFNISLGQSNALTLNALYADFTTGQTLDNYTGPSTDDMVVALQKYLTICESYEDLIVPGLWDFPNATSIPDDLLMQFGDFVEKYGIQAALPSMWLSTGFGVGAMLNELTLSVMQAFGAQMARLFLGLQPSYVPASGRYQDLYDAIASYLGESIYLNTRAIHSKRTDNGVAVTVRNEIDGNETVFHAKKLLIAIQPVGKKLAAFDLDRNEEKVFEKIQYTREYTGIVSSPSIPANISINNLPYSENDNNLLDWQDFNFTAFFQALDYHKDLFEVTMAGDEKLGPEEARAMTEQDFSNLVNSGVFAPSASNDTRLEWVAFSDHGPMHDRVSREDLEAGFVQSLYALQGHRSTWYTGGAWASNYQTILWEYNEILLPRMLAAK